MLRPSAGKMSRKRFRTELDAQLRREERSLLPALRAAGEAALEQQTLRERQAIHAPSAENHPGNLAWFAELVTVRIRFKEKK